MKLRLMKLLLLLPCGIIDGFFVLVVGIPLWVICGVKFDTHIGTVVWLVGLKNKEDEQD